MHLRCSYVFMSIILNFGLMLSFLPSSKAQIPPPLIAIGRTVLLDAGIELVRDLVCEQKSLPVFCPKGSSSKNTPIKVVKKVVSFVARNFDIIHLGASKLYKATLPQPSLLEKGIELGLSKEFLLSAGPSSILIIAMPQVKPIKII